MLLWWINADMFHNGKITVLSYFEGLTRAMQSFWLDIFSVWWTPSSLFLQGGWSSRRTCNCRCAGSFTEQRVLISAAVGHQSQATRGILTWEQTSWWWDPDASVSSWIYSTDLEYIKRESVPDIPVHGLPDSLAIYGRCCFNIPHASKPFHPRENTCGSSLILKTCESFDTCLNNASLWKV